MRPFFSNTSFLCASLISHSFPTIPPPHLFIPLVSLRSLFLSLSTSAYGPVILSLILLGNWKALKHCHLPSFAAFILFSIVASINQKTNSKILLISGQVCPCDKIKQLAEGHISSYVSSSHVSCNY